MNPPKHVLLLIGAATTFYSEFYKSLPILANVRVYIAVRKISSKRKVEYMTLFGNQPEAVKNSAQLLASNFIDRITALGSVYLIPAILGTSYLAMTIASSVARWLLEVLGRAPREI